MAVPGVGNEPFGWIPLKESLPRHSNSFPAYRFNRSFKSRSLSLRGRKRVFFSESASNFGPCVARVAIEGFLKSIVLIMMAAFEYTGTKFYLPGAKATSKKGCLGAFPASANIFHFRLRPHEALPADHQRVLRLQWWPGALLEPGDPHWLLRASECMDSVALDPFWDPILVGIGEFTTHFGIYFSADWDVHTAGIYTHAA